MGMAMAEGNNLFPYQECSALWRGNGENAIAPIFANVVRKGFFYEFLTHSTGYFYCLHIVC